jgi:nitrogen regulatory protein PII
MKLIIITAIKEFETAVKKILFAAGIKEFTCQDVTGCRDSSTESVGDNWFASEINETDSVLFWVMAPDPGINRLLKGAEHFNNGQESQSRIHLAILPIEKQL